VTASEWLDRLAPKAMAILAVGTCASYGGVHAMAGNPTGAMGVPEYLGRDWRSWAGLPVVCVPGCPVQPDNLSETILHLLFRVAGLAPEIDVDEALRPKNKRTEGGARSSRTLVSPRAVRPQHLRRFPRGWRKSHW
jgi:hydrogenase small subunit